MGVLSLCRLLLSDLLTVSETANEPPQDEGNSFNSPRNLAMEATYINHNFSQQCLRMVITAPRLLRTFWSSSRRIHAAEGPLTS